MISVRNIHKALTKKTSAIKETGEKFCTEKISTTTETHVAPQTIIANFYTPIAREEVAPFTRRLINPYSFNTKTGLQKLEEIIYSTRENIENITDENARKTFGKLYEKIITDTTNIENISGGLRVLINKFELIENPNIRTEILTNLDKLSNFKPKQFKEFFEKEMSYTEELIDTINIMNEKYLNTDSAPRRLYKWLDEKNSWFADLIDGEIKPESTYRNGFATIPKKKKNYEKYVKDSETMRKKRIHETFQNYMTLEAFMKFLSIYKDTKKAPINELYHNEYLKKLKPEISDIFREIDAEYGTKVISLNANLTINDAKYLQEELRLWKEAGGDKVQLPEIIEINRLDKHLHTVNASGCAELRKNKITLHELLEFDGSNDGSTLRHEITHLQHKKCMSENPHIRSIKWFFNKLFFGKKWKQELKNGEIHNTKQRNYALTEEDELYSVTSEADMEKLSEWFKKNLVKKLNMKQWIFNLQKNTILLTEKLKNN